MAERLSAEKCFGYLDQFGRATHSVLSPYAATARKRFSLIQVIQIVFAERHAQRLMARKKYEKALRFLARALEMQIAKTYDLVPENAWKTTLPDLGNDRMAFMDVLTRKQLPALYKLFALTA